MSELTRGLTPHDVLAAAVSDAGGSPCQQAPELWFGDHAQQTEAADLCLDCPAFIACADYLKSNPEKWGVWAGTTALERSRQRRKETK